jgi:hypothetical protein
MKITVKHYAKRVKAQEAGEKIGRVEELNLIGAYVTFTIKDKIKANKSLGIA